MTERDQLLDRLRSTLIETAGGFLRNPRVFPGITCADCRGTLTGDWDRCYPCEHSYSNVPAATLLGFATYAIADQQSGYMMRRYKAGSAEHYGIVRMLALLTLIEHWSCPARVAGRPFTHWATVPSLAGRSGQHPLNQMMGAAITDIPEAMLYPTANSQHTREFNANNFATTASLQDAHVLLIDDTWTRGGHLQSAAYTLRGAGAELVTGFVIARWLSPAYGRTPDLLRELQRADFDPGVCPWTSGACPSS